MEELFWLEDCKQWSYAKICAGTSGCDLIKDLNINVARLISELANDA